MGESTTVWQLAQLYLHDEDIETLPVVADTDFRRDCPPLFPEPAVFKGPLAPKYAALNSYYRLQQEADMVTITDNFSKNECYYNRLFMLYTAWRHLLETTGQGLSLLDVAGSSGYYCLHALQQGFQAAICLEGRPEYRDQMALVANRVGLNPRFVVADVEDREALSRQRSDVVLAQGILHHIYDHLSFVQGLYQATGKMLILDTHLNARMDATANMWVENQSNVRDSPFSRLSLCPSLTVLVSLLKCVGFRKIYHVPYPRRVRDTKGNAIDPYRYRSLRRIMLACLP